MEIAIIDDELNDYNILVGYLDQYFLGKSVPCNYHKYLSSEVFLNEFEAERFDIIFLDIFMSGMNGMECAHCIRESDHRAQIIFTSSSRDYAIEGYQVNANYYLVKPFQYDEFAMAMNSCRGELDFYRDFITVKEGRMFVHILIKDIIYTDYYNHYIHIHTRDRIIKTYMRFPDFSPVLIHYPQFLIVYRNCIINMDEVEMFNSKDFIMNGDIYIPIAKAKRYEIRQHYVDYLFEKLSKEK
ncbi:MAG: LytTR family DNA-binding domain-containing protein [Erysipelotrichaceae bacterium]